MNAHLEQYRDAMAATARVLYPHPRVAAPPEPAPKPVQPLRFATITFYTQEAWLTKIGLLSGSIAYKPLNARRHTIDEIQAAVCERYGLPILEMSSSRRDREVARPRQVAMYLSKQLTPRSLPEIGRRFGGRDHTTVIHAVRQIEKLRKLDPALDDDVRTLLRELER